MTCLLVRNDANRLRGEIADKGRCSRRRGTQRSGGSGFAAAGVEKHHNDGASYVQ